MEFFMKYIKWLAQEIRFLSMLRYIITHILNDAFKSNEYQLCLCQSEYTHKIYVFLLVALCEIVAFFDNFETISRC